MLFKIFVCFVVIAFACNVESFPIAMLVFFFSFPFSSLSFDKGLSLTFHDLLPKKLITKIGLIVLDKLKKVCVLMFLKMLFATCLTHVMSCALFTVISIHTRKITKLKIWETRWKMTEKVQLFKVQKTEKSI